MAIAAEVGKAVAAIRSQVSTPFQDSLVSEANGQQDVFFEGSAFPSVGGIFPWVSIADMELDLQEGCDVQTTSGETRV